MEGDWYANYFTHIYSYISNYRHHLRIIEVIILQKYYSDNIPIILVGALLVPLAMIVTVIITHKVFKNKMMNSMKDSEVEKWIMYRGHNL